MGEIMIDRAEQHSNACDEVDMLTILPPELIIHILSFLPNKDIKKLPLVCNLLYQITSDCYSNSLYGRSLRFNKWQSEKVTLFLNNSKLLESQFDVNLLHRPDVRGLSKAGHYFKITILAVTLLALSGLLISKLISFPSSDERKRDLIPTILYFGWPILLLLQMINNMDSIWNRIGQARANYLNSSVRLSDLEKLGEIINKDQDFYDSIYNETFDTTSNPHPGTFTISQLLSIITKANQQLVELSDLFGNYLSEKTRFSPNKYLSHEDLDHLGEIHPKLPSYAKNMSSLWSQENNKKESLFNENSQLCEEAHETSLSFRTT